jgi:hypothetical protein
MNSYDTRASRLWMDIFGVGHAAMVSGEIYMTTNSNAEGQIRSESSSLCIKKSC